MNLKSSVGICSKIQGTDGKIVIIPQDADMFEENQTVVLVAASDLKTSQTK